MAESNNGSNAQKAANAGRRMVKAGKGLVKAVGGDYVGAVKDIIEGFGDIIFKVVGVSIIITFLLLESFVSIFSSLPSMLINNFTEDIDNAITQWQVTKANNALEDILDGIVDDSEKEILKYIQGGYIPDWKANVKNFYDDDSVIKIEDKAFSLVKRDSSNDIFAWQFNIEDNDISTNFVKFADIQSTDVEFDTLYFICAYSVWHQSNDLGSDKNKNGYKEPESKEDRWKEIDTKGLKKFIKKHKDSLLNVKYEFTKEQLLIKDVVTTDDEGNQTTSDEYFPGECITVTINPLQQEDIVSLFDLSEEEQEQVDTLVLIANGLFEGASEGTASFEFTYSPKSELMKSLCLLDDSYSSTDVYNHFDSLPAYTLDFVSTSEGISNITNDTEDEENAGDNSEQEPPDDTDAEAGKATGYMIKPTKTGTYSDDKNFPYYSSTRWHGGYDIPVGSGTPVYACDGGEVVKVKHLQDSYGNYIVVKSGNYYFYYCHLSDTLTTKAGDKVKKGQLIGKSGSTGNSTGPHLHLEVRKGDNHYQVINPYEYMDKNISYFNGKIY